MFEADSSCLLFPILEKSTDINYVVDKKLKEEQGAFDQRMMFGYAKNETEELMPLNLDLAHKILIELSTLRRDNKTIKYL